MKKNENDYLKNLNIFPIFQQISGFRDHSIAIYSLYFEPQNIASRQLEKSQ